MEKKSQVKILLTGAVFGAIGAVLLALRSGQKTRERLAKQTQWAGQKFGDLSKGIAEQVKKIAEREAVHNESDNAGLYYGEQIDQVRYASRNHSEISQQREYTQHNESKMAPIYGKKS